ncbi:MAG: hypothetical protein KBS66_00600 [Eubacterium sp.]|nr:hypothetical protein [Candidatus Colimonas fimequi]
MTRAQIKTILENIGLPYEYDHFEVGKAPALPFIVFTYPQTENFGADNKVYAKINYIDIALYADHKDFALEDRIEAVLDEYGLFYNKNEVFIQSENAYQITYELEELING